MKKRKVRKLARSSSVPNEPCAAPAAAAAPTSPRSRTAIGLAFALVVLIVIVYAPVRDYGYVDYDDDSYVTENPNIANGLTRESVRWAFTTNHGGFWMPVTWLSYMLDIHLFGVSGGAQHVVNVAIHTLSTLLLFGFLLRVTSMIWQSAFAAALFAIHPLHVESVVWIAERKDMLSGLFWMAALWAYAFYVRRPSVGRYAAVAAGFALALMSKPMAVTLPFVLLLLDVWPLQRLSLRAVQWAPWRRAALEKIPLLVMAGVFSALTFTLHESGGGIMGFTSLGLEARAANAIRSYGAYIAGTAWPAPLATFYPYGPVVSLGVVVSGLLLAAVTVLAVRNVAARPYLLVGWLWYLGTLLPVIGLIQAGLQSRADRFTYIPLIGLSIMASWGIPELAARLRQRRLILAAGAVVIVGALSVAARNQVGYWESRTTLWGHALEVTEENYMAHSLLALALVDEGQVDDAIRHYQEALRISPGFTQAHNNLGVVLAEQGRTEQAISAFTNAIQIGPVKPDMHYNLGYALAQQGRFDEAIAQYTAALRLQPVNAAAVTKIGDALQSQGKVEEAILKYAEALRMQPDFVLAHNNLAVALSILQRADEAAFHYMTALRIKPDLAEAHNGLGVVLANQGKLDEAIAHFREAVRLQPSLQDARSNLESALAAENETSAWLPDSEAGN